MDKHNRYGGDKGGFRPSERKGPRTGRESTGQVGGEQKDVYGRVRKRQEAEQVRLAREQKRQEAEQVRLARERQERERKGPRTGRESTGQVGGERKGSKTEALGQRGDLEPSIAALREDNRVEVRERAAEALGQRGDLRAVEPLIAALREDNSGVEVRERQNSLFSKQRGPRTDRESTGRVGGERKDDYGRVRKRAAEALGRLGDLRAVEPLIAALREDNRVEVRERAAEALGRLGDLRAVEPLIAALREDNSGVEVREQAAEALARLQSQLRYLHARHPERVRVGDPIPLQVRVALSPALSKSIPLRTFPIPSQGVDVKLVLDCPGFLLHSDSSMATVHVIPEVDSDWALFELEALHEGVSTLEVSAYHGGAFLGTLSTQLTVDSLASRGKSVDRFAPAAVRQPQEGEVTLAIRYDPFSAVYRYQLRSAIFGEIDELRSGPLLRTQEKAIADLIASLNKQARDLTGYSAKETRAWLQGKGTELWNELIPKELENVFWQQRDKITHMTILSAGDPMPWEVMYTPKGAGHDAGFLAELFPVVRWMFGPAPTALLHCAQPFFVLPEDAPSTAADELAALRQIIGGGQEVNELTPLLNVFDQADFDILHFACHNNFRSDSPTSSSIQMGSKSFVPTFLSTYERQFYQRSPLVFLNACRSAGMAANYTWLSGWAKSFLTAGAGAFVGSSWEVRDESAKRFAEVFYQALVLGVPLGDAMIQARTEIQKKPSDPSDPTWLAYTLYGNPAAVLSKETPKLG